MQADAVEQNLVQDSSRRFVLVTGAGRSGTSTVAGALNMLGVHVPPPFLRANESNPRGFFESSWPVRFHNDLMDEAYVATVDSRPESIDHVRAAITDERRRELRDWLLEATSHAPQTAVKDPRAVWTIDLWHDTVAELGMTTGYVMMLRHPAEVVGSRATHYGERNRSLGVRGFAIKNVAGWINSNLVTEHQTRTRARVLVRYEDLLRDWRRSMTTVRDALDLRFNDDLTGTGHHAVDDFVDPALHRHPVTWDDIDIPDPLRQMADQVWRACSTLAEKHDDDALVALDDVRDRYTRLVDDARALAFDETTSEARRSADAAATEATAEMRAKLAKVRARARRAESAAARPSSVQLLLGRIRQRIRRR